MNRGDALQWGIQIDTDGKRWTVMLVGSQRADWTFDTFSALVEWLEDQNEGLQIGRMGRGAIETAIRMTDAELVTEIAKTLGDKSPRWGGMPKPKVTEPCGCPTLPFPPRPGCPHHDEMGSYIGGKPDA